MANLSNRVIITAALTGAGTPRALNPNIPYTPQEIADDAYACWKAGAAMVHLHMRDENGHGSMDAARFRETISLIRAHRDCDVIINCTSSGATKALPDEARMEHFCTIPEIEVGSFDCGSFNWADMNIFDNHPNFLHKLAEVYRQYNVKPEVELFDCGMLNNAKYYQKKGWLPEKLYFQCVLGVLGGMEATVENLLYLVNHMPPNSQWSAFGIGKGQLSILYAALALGCTGLRVGLEDNLIQGVDDNGQKILATNVSLVQQAAAAVYAYGKKPATPGEAREILGIR